MEKPEEKRVYQELHHNRYEKVYREYSKVTWIDGAVTIQDPYDQGQEVYDPIDYVRYGKNIRGHS
jgi:hypothetical protein